jgi:hypothetical protein
MQIYEQNNYLQMQSSNYCLKVLFIYQDSAKTVIKNELLSLLCCVKIDGKVIFHFNIVIEAPGIKGCLPILFPSGQVFRRSGDNYFMMRHK